MPPSPPVAPPAPSLPPGVEILRPNQDIQVRVWQPRPVFLQLNEYLNLTSPDPDASVICAPATVEIYDESTGCFQETRRPRCELGLTDPTGSGPWAALQLRFRAVRSRPPQPEIVRDPPPLTPEIPAPRNCPAPFIARPLLTDLVGNWQSPPFELLLTESTQNPTGLNYISAPVLSPPGNPARLETTKPPHWDQGWNRITLRLSARARAARVVTPGRTITGMNARLVTWTDSTQSLPPPPPVIPHYKVRWNPFDHANNLHAFQVSGQEVKGNGILSTDTTISGVFSLTSSSLDFILTEVSLDDITYGPTATFTVTAFESLVIYYRITILSGGTTSSGNHTLALTLEITGPDFTTPAEIITWPAVDPPLILSVASDTTRTMDLETTARIKVSLWGNETLELTPVQYTGTLTSDWTLYQLVWDGFWDGNQINDLHFDLQATPSALADDAPFVDMEALETELNPYCPGLDPPPRVPVLHTDIPLYPTTDLSVTGWEPLPAYSYLVSDVTRVSSDLISVDPRVSNRLVLGMSDIPVLPPPAANHSRVWNQITVTVQASLVVTGSTQASLLVSTNFGSEQATDTLTSEISLYSVSWDYPDSLTVDQLNRLEVSVLPQVLVSGSDEAILYLLSLQATATYQDVFTGTPVSPPPPPPPVAYIAVLDPTAEVFSCGSLGDCSGSAVGHLMGRVTVDNTSFLSTGSIMFVSTGNLKIRIFDTLVPATEYPLNYTIPASTLRHFSIFGYVGKNTEPYPVDPMSGCALVSFNYGSGVEDKQISWYYIGF